MGLDAAARYRGGMTMRQRDLEMREAGGRGFYASISKGRPRRSRFNERVKAGRPANVTELRTRQGEVVIDSSTDDDRGRVGVPAPLARVERGGGALMAQEDWVHLPSGMFMDLGKVTRFLFVETGLSRVFIGGDVQFLGAEDAAFVRDMLARKVAAGE